MERHKTVIDKITSGREYRNTTDFTVKTESTDYMVKGYATVFQNSYNLYKDADYEIREQIASTAFENCDMSDVILQYNHEGRVFARVSNHTLTLNADEHGLYIEAYLGGTEEGKQLYEEIKGGYTTKMSFGFTVRNDEITEIQEDGHTIYTRTITDISKLYDVSAVSMPANDATEITARAYSDGLIKEAISERQKLLRQKLLLKLKIMEDI